MKTSLFFTLLLLFILATQSILSATAANGDATAVVYDIDGKKVRQDSSYYIGPVEWAKGGGIKLSNRTCPFNVVQDPKETSIGGKFSFTLSAPKEKVYVREEYNLGIDSGFPKGACTKSTFWQIEDAEGKPPSNLVKTGAQFDEGESCFQIVKFPKPTMPKVKSYMLQHCPYYCGGTPPITCYNVSTYVQNGIKRLASGGTPFEFVLKKVT